jgi:alkylated DNA repair dioxygenase AlkB
VSFVLQPSLFGSLGELGVGEPFVSVGLYLYRDGSDSVAWHGVGIARESPHDTMVAIVSLGAAVAHPDELQSVLDQALGTQRRHR